MAQLVIAAAGAAIGSAIAPGVVALGLTGGGIGWIVGSLIGSTFGPTQKASGPRLGDLSVGGSAYGSVIPYIEGHPRVAGQIIWASSKREIATTRRESGKGGGGGTAVTTYTYEVDLLIELTDCTIAGIRRIWSGGDLVYTAATDADGNSVNASYNAPQWTRMTVYTGASDQLPDPDYSAAVGEDNAPAYRGRGTVFIKSLQLGQGGQIPNLTFEVVRTGTVGSGLLMRELVSGVDNTFPNYLTDLGFGVQWYDADVKAFGVSSLGAGRYAGDYRDEFGVYSSTTLARMRRQFPGITTELGGNNWTIDGWVYITDYSEQTLFTLGEFANPYAVLKLDPDGRMYPVLYRGVTPFWNSGVGDGVSFSDIADNNYPTANSLVFLKENFLVANPDATDTELVWHVSRHPTPIPLNQWVHIGMYRYEGRHFTAIGDNYHEHGWFAGGLAEDLGSDPAPYVHHGNGAILPFQQQASTSYMGWYYPLSMAVATEAERLFNIASSNDPKVPFRIGGQGICDDVRFDSVRLAHAAIFVQGSTDTEYSWDDPPAVDENSITIYPFDVIELVGVSDPSISTVVSRLCTDLAGLDASQFSVTALSTITTPVHGMVISQVSTVRSVLEMLMGCYFFDCVLSDKLYFRPRAGAAVATLTNDELGWVVEGQDFPDPLPLTIANELELPAQMALTYNNIDGDYQTDTQYSDRLISGQENTTVIQVPLGFTAAEAKIIADARLTDAYVARLTSQISLNLSHSNLEPSDVVQVYGSDGSLYRQRLTKRTDSECVLVFDTVADDSTVFTRLGITVGGTDSQTTVAGLPDTDIELLDIPLLRDADNTFGIYVAVTGGDTWHAGDVYHSVDNVNYTADATFTQQAVIGTTDDALDDWSGGTVFDEISSVTVDVGDGELESVTRSEILNNQEINAAVIGDELVQFRDAVLQSAGVYKLTGFLRGRRGTEWAMVDHEANERFVLLTTSGMRFLPLQVGDFARLRYYKGVSAGQRLSVVTAETITPMGVGLKPWAPVNVRVSRTGVDPVVTWSRRTRLSTRVGGPVQSIPLGEASEAYEVDVYSDDTFTTVIDTISTTSATATITEAGSPTGGPLYLRIYQISEAVGRGYPAEVTLN
jgi:hypothetical protein